MSGCANPSLGMHHASCPNRLGEEPPSPVRSPASSKRSKGRNPSWMAAKSLPDLPGELAKEAAKDEAAALTANNLLSISGNNLNHHRSHKFDMQGKKKKKSIVDCIHFSKFFMYGMSSFTVRHIVRSARRAPRARCARNHFSFLNWRNPCSPISVNMRRSDGFIHILS